jgi:hypothetical protein
MRFLISLLLIIFLAFIAGIYLPWWSIAVIAFAVGIFVPQSIGKSFLAGFFGIFLLWGLLAFWIDSKNESLLSQKIAQLFSLGNSSIALILLTALIGAFVGGFAAVSGSSLRPATKKY